MVVERIREMIREGFRDSDNRTSLTGAGITTAAALTMLFFFVIEVVSPHHVNPYFGILLFVFLPMLFVLGLAMIPLGIWMRRRKMRKDGTMPTGIAPKLAFGSPVLKHILTFVAVATLVNVFLVGTAAYKSVEFMDSTEFCGKTCHVPMTPEFTAFKNSPHSRVGCAQCHVGPGAEGFIKAKLSGTRQLFGVAFNSFERPIKSPVESLRPARETCEQCHWPTKFHDDKIFVHTSFGEDETNTPSTNVLMLKIGGHGIKGRTGIHGRHLDDASRISYVTTDEKRMEIPEVTYKDDQGNMVKYISTSVKMTPELMKKARTRTMDCVDCHNRPTHAFELPDRGLDKAMTDGRISPELPYIKQQAMLAIKAEYPSQEVAAQKIKAAITGFYQEKYPALYAEKKAMVEASAVGVASVYLRNIFPDMKITWGTHLNHIGHEESTGCFRCHDGEHKAADGRVITNDCDACHTVLAQGEKDPKVLKDLGWK